MSQPMEQAARSLVARWINGLPINLENTIDLLEHDSSDTESESSVLTESQASNGTDQIEMDILKESISHFGAVISSRGGSQVRVNEAIDYIDIPSYPKTSSLGIAHFIHFSQPLLEKDAGKADFQKVAAQLISKVQFALSLYQSPNLSKLDALQIDPKTTERAWHQSWTCSGIKHCEHVHPHVLRSCREYDNVQLTEINNLRKQYHSDATPKPLFAALQRHTTSFWNAFLLNWKQEIGPCILSTGERICQGQQPELFTRNKRLFLGCPLNCNAEPWHFAQSIPKTTNRYDLKYLEALVNCSIQLSPQQCVYIGHPLERRKFCGEDHPSGQGTIRHTKCKVRFDLYIPQNMQRFSYICLVARGSHTHHPPYPTRMPSDIANDVVNAIRQTDVLIMTPHRFMISPPCLALLRRYNAVALQEIHKSLIIEDRLRALIRKERILRYPMGTSIAGVERELSITTHLTNEQQWIRKIFYFEDNIHFCIICCTYQQAKAFQKAIAIEVDMAFKMVQGKTNVFSIVGWDEDAKKTLTYIYAFINWDSRIAYAKLFEMVFSIIEETSRDQVQFWHIHSTLQSIHTIGLDMCKKQAGGLGDYFHSLDSSRTWNEHLQHILVFCSVHVKRNFAKKFPQHPFRHQLDEELWTAENISDLERRMDGLCIAYAELTPWINNKRVPWIMAGLSKGCSKVPLQYWQFARKHTGLCESSHFVDNFFTGRKRALLGAVLQLKIRVDIAFKKLQDQEEGFPSTWRNRSTIYQLATQQRKVTKRNQQAATRRQTKPYLPWHPLNPYDTPTIDAQHMPSINSDQVEEEDSLILQSDINSIVSESTQTSYLTLPQSEPSIYQPSSQYIPHSQHLYPQSHFNSQRSTTRSVASASTQHMPAVRSTSKRRRATGSRTEIDIRTERVESLRKKVEETRQIKALEQEEERLQAELQQLES